MQTFRIVLAAVDFGEASNRALALAGSIAQATGATLRVLHAEQLEAPPYFTPAQLAAIEGEAQANRDRASDYLRSVARAHVTSPFETIVESRAAADAILHASAGADLIVMGTHGRRGPSRWWLGSVAERVIRDTTVPVLVVHALGPVPTARAAFRSGMVLQPPLEGWRPRTHALASAMARAFGGTTFALGSDDPRQARAASGATWVAVPAPVPRTAQWLSEVAEPFVQGCAMPVLFVPETVEGSTS
jgi:nucleotide-binding universal stress UspA family protein